MYWQDQDPRARHGLAIATGVMDGVRDAPERPSSLPTFSSVLPPSSALRASAPRALHHVVFVVTGCGDACLQVPASLNSFASNSIEALELQLAFQTLPF